MKTLTNRQQQLLERHEVLIKAISENHGDILNWYCDKNNPETLCVQTCCFDQVDVMNAAKLGFYCCMYSDNDVNNLIAPRIEVHIITFD